MEAFNNSLKSIWVCRQNPMVCPIFEYYWKLTERYFPVVLFGLSCKVGWYLLSMWTKSLTVTVIIQMKPLFMHVAVHVLSHGPVCCLQGPSEHLKYKEKNITLVHNNKWDQKWLCLSLKPAAFEGPKKFVLMTFERQREVFSHEEGTFIAYICFIFLYICFYPVGDSRNKCNQLIFPFEYTSVSSCHYHDDNMMKSVFMIRQ